MAGLHEHTSPGEAPKLCNRIKASTLWSIAVDSGALGFVLPLGPRDASDRSPLLGPETNFPWLFPPHSAGGFWKPPSKGAQPVVQVKVPHRDCFKQKPRKQRDVCGLRPLQLGRLSALGPTTLQLVSLWQN